MNLSSTLVVTAVVVAIVGLGSSVFAQCQLDPYQPDGSHGAADYFGNAVAIDGDWAVIGMSGEDSQAGSVFIWHYDGADWCEYAKISEDETDQGDLYGNSVAIYSDVVVVGAPGWEPDEGGALDNKGKAYVYRRDANGDWLLEQGLEPSDPENGAFFGGGESESPRGVAIDRGTIIIAAPQADVDSYSAGKVYVFRYDSASSEWDETQIIENPDPHDFEKFGRSVAVSRDVLVVGAPSADSNKGAVYFYREDPLSVEDDFVLEDEFAGGATGDFLGWSVDLDVDTAIAGAVSAGDEGEVRVYEFNGTDWDEETVDGPADSDDFGHSVGISGSKAIVGAATAEINSDPVGSAYLMKPGPSGWVVNSNPIEHSSPNFGDKFGFSVDIDVNTAVVGAPLDEIGTPANEGSAFIVTGLPTCGAEDPDDC